jgi:uncharacterized surface protein with fasciclin (FAS1) repeats
MKLQFNMMMRATVAMLAAMGLSHAQEAAPTEGAPTAITDDPILLLPDRVPTTPAENIAPVGSLPARTGAATGRAQSVRIDRQFAQAPAAPPVPVVSPPSLTAFEILSASERHTTFITAIRAVGLARTLQGPGSFTIFAPDNNAFASLPQGVAESLLLPENRATLRSILAYHIIPRRISNRNLLPGLVTTAQGERMEFVGGMEGVVTVQDARIMQADVVATNGVIHSIDLVLVPPSISPFLIQYYATTPNRALVSPFEGLIVE